MLKSLFLHVALTLLLFDQASGEEVAWQSEARDYLKEHQFTPIEIKPTSRSQLDVSRERWQWMERVLMPALSQHLEKRWPKQAERSRSFVKQCLQASIRHPEMDLRKPPATLEAEGSALEKEGVDEPLVLWATSWAIWEQSEGYGDALSKLGKAARDKSLRDYPAVLLLMIRQLEYTIRDVRNKQEDNHFEDRFIAGIQAATDPKSYTAQDDELMHQDLHFLTARRYFDKHLEEQTALVASPHFTPWLREMMQGHLHSEMAWASRGTGFVNTVSNEGWRGFEKQMPVAATHFTKAWELRPDRPQGAGKMIDVVKAGYGAKGETTRLWFDRAISAQFDHHDTYYEYVWAIRPRWGGSLEAMGCLLLACALADRPDTELSEIALNMLSFLRSDMDVTDDRVLLKEPLIKHAVLHTARALAAHPSRVWERAWRQADVGVYTWKGGDFELADKLLNDTPTPFPRQTRRNIKGGASEVDVRGESAIFAIGMAKPWAEAEEAFSAGKAGMALDAYQSVAAQFFDNPPTLLRERVATCEFEVAFAKGDWVSMPASPDMERWNYRSGDWSGAPDGTLTNRGHDAQGYLFHNGRVGRDFELRGDYTIETGNPYQGISIILGYHNIDREHFIAPTQWSASKDGSLVTLLKDFAQSKAPQLSMRSDDRTWRFHIICRDGRVTHRLQHTDMLLHDNSTGYEMPENGIFGLCHYYFRKDSVTRVRNLQIRKLTSDTTVDTIGIESLHDAMQLEIADRIQEEQKAGRTEAISKLESLSEALKKSPTAALTEFPAVMLQERALHSLLRGYHLSYLRRAQAAGAPTPLKLAVEETLAPENRIRWQPESGQWRNETDVALLGTGDSSIHYDFGRAPPFRIDFEITVLDGKRPRLILGNVKFANEGNEATFGLYPRPKGAKLLPYEHGKPYEASIRAGLDKTELFINGQKACEAPRIEGLVPTLQLRSGDDYSKGKTLFRHLRILPLDWQN